MSLSQFHPAVQQWFSQNIGTPTNALMKVGGFNEAFTIYGMEDIELGRIAVESRGPVGVPQIRIAMWIGSQPVLHARLNLSRALERGSVPAQLDLEQVDAMLDAHMLAGGG